MKDKELRKLIGSRAKQRRLELNLTHQICGHCALRHRFHACLTVHCA